MNKSRKKKSDVVYKIDLEKAYDHVNWDSLRNCLVYFGFLMETIQLIMRYVTSSTLSLIWNGKCLPSYLPISL